MAEVVRDLELNCRQVLQLSQLLWAFCFMSWFDCWQTSWQDLWAAELALVTLDGTQAPTFAVFG